MEAAMGTKFDDWAAQHTAAETPGEAELRHRFEAAIELGLQFRDARVTLGVSQRELSERSGVRQADISRIERGAGNPTEATLQRLATALDKHLELALGRHQPDSEDHRAGGLNPSAAHWRTTEKAAPGRAQRPMKRARTRPSAAQNRRDIRSVGWCRSPRYSRLAVRGRGVIASPRTPS